MIALAELGFRPFFANQIDRLGRPELVPARIAADGRGPYPLAGCRAALGELSGRLRYDLEGASRPAVGDWVAVADGAERAMIHHVLERQTVLRRRAADSDVATQVIAANVDCFCIVTSANRDLNPRRLERYVSAVWDSGAMPVVVLNKVDLVADPAPLIEDIAAVAFGVPIVEVSALTGQGIDALRAQIGRGTTVGLVGSSGVGKSSLINRLLGEEVQHVHAVREDDARGRHTTTRRELLLLPGGGVLIDNPGMRELGMVEDGGGVEVTFADIAQVALSCRFGDCRHDTEPGCAVQKALVSGEIDAQRWRSYQKLQREIAAFETRRDPVLASEERRRWKIIHKSLKSHPKAEQWR